MTAEYHVTKDGDRIKISELATEHLINIVGVHIKKAQTGLEIYSGSYSNVVNEIDVDMVHARGLEALDKMHTEHYLSELLTRLRSRR